MQRLIRYLMLVALIGVLTACSDDPITPTTPTPRPMVTETFSGTVNRNGAVTHNFTTEASGTVTVTLTTLGPNSALVVGMSLGTSNGSTCTLVITKDDATQGTVVNGGVSSLGSVCVRIYDVGNIVDPITYEITVVHP
jgi:hypothetical protein